MYSRDRFTNWAEYDPAWAEVQAVHKKFDSRISKNPDFPKIITLPVMDGFLRCCSPRQVEWKLHQLRPEFIEGLRAVFILAGSRKQLKSWSSSVTRYGTYWRSCVFLHAYPAGQKGTCLTSLHDFFIRDVLVHEVGHHVDQRRSSTTKERERFAEAFAREHG
jgi:hypothetical protein